MVVNVGEVVSWLFVPGDQTHRFAKAAASGAGGIILDLEDAVALTDRPAARAAVAEYLRAPREVACAVRLGAATDRAVLEDLAACAKHAAAPDALLLPKVEASTQVRAVRDGVVRMLGCDVPLISMIESARGVLQSVEIAVASDAVMFGEADLAASLGCAPSSSRIRQAVATALLGTSMSEVPVIASPWFDIADQAGLTSRAAQDAEDGFSAKAAIHPSQIVAIERAFLPGDPDIGWARRALDAMREGAVGMVDGEMVDEAIARRARRIIARAESVAPNSAV